MAQAANHQSNRLCAFWLSRSAACLLLLLAAPSGCATRQGRPLPATARAPVLPEISPQARAALYWEEPFQELDPNRWHEISLKDHTAYSVVDLNGRRCLKAESRSAASALLSPVHFDPNEAPWLSWQWRVEKPVEKEALQRRDGADAAARLYVYFDSEGLPWQKRSVDYVWSSKLPVETFLRSPYSSLSKVIVVDGPSEAIGQWGRVERNLVEDYQRCFKAAPKPVVAISIMTDTDNTRGEAVAYFADIRISRMASTASAKKQ